MQQLFSEHRPVVIQKVIEEEIMDVNGFMELVDKNFREEKMASGYAAQLTVTANYLSKIVKKTPGFLWGITSGNGWYWKPSAWPVIPILA